MCVCVLFWLRAKGKNGKEERNGEEERERRERAGSKTGKQKRE